MSILRIVTFTFFLALYSATAEEKRYDQQFPKLDFRSLLSLMASLEKKPVIVSDPEVFQIETSLILPDATTSESRKVLHAILLINGYELVERGGELHLTRLLSREQCTAMMNALSAYGDFPKHTDGSYPRVRVVQKQGQEVDPPANRVIVREAK